MSKKALLAIVVASLVIIGLGSWYISSTLLKDSTPKSTATAQKGTTAPGGSSTRLGNESSNQSQQSQPSTTEPSAAPAKVVATGKELPEVTNPPEKTLAMIELKDGSKQEHSIQATFKLYGSAMGGQAFVLAVSKASSDSENETIQKVVKRLTGSNIVVEATPESQKVITEGGQYKGVVVTVPQGGTTYGFRLKSAEKISK